MVLHERPDLDVETAGAHVTVDAIGEFAQAVRVAGQALSPPGTTVLS